MLWFIFITSYHLICHCFHHPFLSSFPFLSFWIEGNLKDVSLVLPLLFIYLFTFYHSSRSKKKKKAKQTHQYKKVSINDNNKRKKKIYYIWWIIWRHQYFLSYCVIFCVILCFILLWSSVTNAKLEHSNKLCQ